MSISPFSFKELGVAEGVIIDAVQPKAFLPQGRKKEVAAPPPPPPPVFSENDLKSAERDGYQKGFLDGIEEGKRAAANEQAEIEAMLSQTTEKFIAQLPALFETYRGMLKLAGKQVPELANAIARKVAGCALEEKAYSVIEDIALRCMETMHHEPQLIIVVHERLASTLEEKINSLSAAQKGLGTIIVQPDSAITPANCRIEWKNGALVRDTESLWKQVDVIIESMVASNVRDAEAITDLLQDQSNEALSNPVQPDQGE